MSMILPGAPPTLEAEAPSLTPFKFSGDAKEFVWLCIRGALLQLVTFGFYRFWLVTDIRRHLWSHTSINDEPLEYTGRAKELFIGFLIALAILVPVNLAYFLVGLEVERARAFASLPLLLFYTMFGQFAVYRARRYRLTRTIWRGVRFWMTGSGWSYAFRWLGWGLVSLITLGLAYPWMRASLERYKLSNTFYGDVKGAFTGRGSHFFGRGIHLWVLCMAPLVLTLAAFLSAGGSGAGFRRSGAATGLTILAGLLFLLVPFVWPFFRALEWRWWAQGVRLGELRLESAVTGGAILKLYVKMIFTSMFVALGIGIALTTVGTIVGLIAGVSWSGVAAIGSAKSGLYIGAILSVLVGYLITLLAIGVVQRFYATRDLWRIIATSITVSHLAALDNVAARGEAANALGEGLADGLDVAGF